MKWLVPQRKSGEVESSHSTEDSTRTNKSQTWPKGNRKGPIPTIDIRRSEDIHRIVVLPPLPDTPKSWCSSVYSCEDEAKFVSPRSSPTPPSDERSRQRSPSRTPQRSPLLTPQQLEWCMRPRSSSLVPLAPPLILYSPPSSPRSRPHQDSSPVSLLGPTEDFLSARHSADEPTPTKWNFERGHSFESQTSMKSAPGTLGRPSDIEQLIRETDEAFKLWNSPLSHGLTDSMSDRTRDSGLVRRASLARRTSQRSNRSSTGPTKSPTKAAKKSPLSTQLSGQSSVLGTKKVRPKKSNRRPRGSGSWPTSRWTLTGTAKDLFTIRIFNRIEADEMLPESVLQEIRMSRATQARLAREAAADKESDAESDAGHVEEQSTQPGIPIIIHEDVDAHHSAPPARGKDSERQEQEHIESPVDSTAPYKDEDVALPIMMAVDEQAPPPPGVPVNKPWASLTAPQSKNHRRRSPMKQAAPLPTIPEVIAVGADTFLSPTSQRVGAPRLNTDDYIFLPATPYTFNMRTFRQGPIRLSKADLPIGKLAAAVDDTLDWTAFQMAIIGGAGDFFGESTDYSRPSDTELAERDDMATWFAGFGFDGPGMLVSATDALRLQRETPPMPAPAQTPTPPNPPAVATAPPRTRTPVAELESPQTQQQPQSQLRPQPQPPRYANIVKRVDPGSRLTPPEYFLSTGIGLGQEGVTTYHNLMTLPGGYTYTRPRSGFGFSASGMVANHVGLHINPAKRGSAESTQSLPQSPMLDLVVSRDVDGNEYVVPMGFNLGHDLGDFLKWEAENVFGGGYYGPDPA